MRDSSAKIPDGSRHFVVHVRSFVLARIEAVRCQNDGRQRASRRVVKHCCLQTVATMTEGCAWRG